MSDTRTLSDEQAELVVRLDRLLRERERTALTRSILEATVALSQAIAESVLAEPELTDEHRELLGVVLERQGTAYARLARRASAEKWLDAVAAHALKRVTEEVLT